MTYDIHPIFVHFPIALLVVYSIIKILPFKKWFPQVTWNYLESILLLIGVLGAFISSSTGEVAEHLTKANKNLVEMHSTFAGISTWLYGLLLLGEILVLLTPKLFPKFNLPKTSELVLFIQNLLTNPISSKIIAFLGLIAISITGMLGGVIVYGVSADPLAPMLLKLLGITL